MFNWIIKCFRKSTKQAAITPGDYEHLLYYYCILSKTTEVEYLLKKSGNEIDLAYQNCALFTIAINQEDIDILSALLDAASKKPEQYRQIKSILKDIVDSSYVSLKVQKILAKHISIRQDEEDIYMHFDDSNYEYESSKFTLLRVEQSEVSMILPLTEYNLKISTFPYWKKASECYSNKADLKDAIDMIDDWHDLNDSIYPKAMIIYNYLLHTNNLDYVKSCINDDALTNSYLHIVYFISTLSGNYVISRMIDGYYLYNAEKADDSVEEEVDASYHPPTDCDSELSEGLSYYALEQYRLSGDSYDDGTVLIN